MSLYNVIHEYILSCNPLFLKLGCAALAGAVLGFEREYHGHAAGLRTIMLVCVAPALMVLVCDEFFEDRDSLSRIAQGLFAGVGFIGGGVILKHNSSDNVRGVTTAAVLWTATMIGFTFGLGNFLIGFLGLGIAFFIVYVLTPVTSLFHTRRRATITVIAATGAFTAKQGLEILRRLGFVPTVATFDFNNSAGAQTFAFSISYRASELAEIPARVQDAIAPLPGVTQVRWN